MTFKTFLVGIAGVGGILLTGFDLIRHKQRIDAEKFALEEEKDPHVTPIRIETAELIDVSVAPGTKLPTLPPPRSK